MTDHEPLRDIPDVNEAVQAVVDRVLSWHAGAPLETIETELRSGLAEIDEHQSDEWVSQTAQRIHDTSAAGA